MGNMFQKLLSHTSHNSKGNTLVDFALCINMVSTTLTVVQGQSSVPCTTVWYICNVSFHAESRTSRCKLLRSSRLLFHPCPLPVVSCSSFVDRPDKPCRSDSGWSCLSSEIEFSVSISVRPTYIQLLSLIVAKPHSISRSLNESQSVRSTIWRLDPH